MKIIGTTMIVTGLLIIVISIRVKLQLKRNKDKCKK